MPGYATEAMTRGFGATVCLVNFRAAAVDLPPDSSRAIGSNLVVFIVSPRIRGSLVCGRISSAAANSSQKLQELPAQATGQSEMAVSI
jgi:hypothetical protein